ncbi:MAG: helix-turn-helix domain-containing protein [Geodermatophilaceae bacterium]
MDAMLLKVPDVVACLGVSRAKVYELMASGELPSVRVGGSRRIRACDLESFVTDLDASWRKGLSAGPHSSR